MIYLEVFTYIYIHKFHCFNEKLGMIANRKFCNYNDIKKIIKWSLY